ncbi:MAG: arginine deiminase-related protein [Acidobacteriota bacterium]
MRAITREISPNIKDCELTHFRREAIDLPLAYKQHRQYEDALRELGCEVMALAAEPDFPDSVFVEDTALVFDELAIITRPGAKSRRPETQSIAKAIEPFRKLQFIKSPATLDGGDVLTIDKQIFIGRSSRTDTLAIEQARTILAPFGYDVRSVEVKHCLHLKSAVSRLAKNTLLINASFVDRAAFAGFDFIEVDEREPFAANALLIQDTVIYPADFPKTRMKIEAAGVQVEVVEMSELIKAEGAVTCCSLIFRR